MPDQQRIVRTGTPNLAMLPALVASLSLFESLGGVPVIAARLRELSGHLRAELVEAGKPHDCCWGSDLRFLRSQQ